MQIIPVTSVIVPPERQRKSINLVSLDALALSISRKGLMHPIVCSYDEATSTYTLVAGQRRWLAVQQLHREGVVYSCDGQVLQGTDIPVILITDLDDIDLREAELDENLIREDLTWQERTEALAELHHLRVARNPQHTISATTVEFKGKTTGAAKDKTSRALIIAQHLDDPEVAAARDEREAFGIVARKTETLFRDRLAEQYKRPASPHTLIHGDLRDVMQMLPEQSVDLVIADPPYGIAAGDFGDAAQLRHDYEDTKQAADVLCACILMAAGKCCKEEAHLYMFCDIDSFTTLRDIAESEHWTPLRTPLIWHKGAGGHLPMGLYGFRRMHELILFASRGKKKLSMTADDVIRISAARDKDHAAEKPADLYAYLMSLSCSPGETVLDPCCGSGTVFEAAHKQHCIATGIELNDKYHGIAQQRLGWIEEELV